MATARETDTDLARRFEAAWQSGPPPALADFLPAEPGARRAGGSRPD